jgi:hypothetical protein
MSFRIRADAPLFLRQMITRKQPIIHALKLRNARTTSSWNLSKLWSQLVDSWCAHVLVFSSSLKSDIKCRYPPPPQARQSAKGQKRPLASEGGFDLTPRTPTGLPDVFDRERGVDGQSVTPGGAISDPAPVLQPEDDEPDDFHAEEPLLEQLGIPEERVLEIMGYEDNSDEDDETDPCPDISSKKDEYRAACDPMFIHLTSSRLLLDSRPMYGSRLSK